jgi:hypothetical protein
VVPNDVPTTAMRFAPLLAAPPWHWWIAVNLLILDVIILIGLGVLWFRMVVAPRYSRRHDTTDRPPGGEGAESIGQITHGH